MEKLTMEVEVEYNEKIMHGGKKDKEAKKWFFNEILFGKNLMLVDCGDMGDTIGSIKVKKIMRRV